jgi:hypothetical protein
MSTDVLETGCSSEEIGVFSGEFWRKVGFSNGVSRILGSSAER